jgi:hypothetical protein
LIRRGQKCIQRSVSRGNRCAPVEEIVDTNFHHLDIAIVGGERIACKERGPGRNEERPVAQSEIVVFELHRPIVRERIFEASAHQPAAGAVVAAREAKGTAVERHARRGVGDGEVVAADPAAASLAVEQPVINGPAEAGSYRCDPAIVVGDDNVPNARNKDSIVVIVVGRPVEVPFAADDELADLIIAADLPAADEYAVVAVVEVRQEDAVRPAVVGPGTANVGADVEPGPTEHGHRRWRRGLDGKISRMRSQRTKQHRGTRQIFEKTFHVVPPLIEKNPHFAQYNAR